jgi:hypothetical protein
MEVETMKKLPILSVLVLLAVPWVTSDMAFAKGGGANFCAKTANKVFQSCWFDIGDELKETQANCLNIADADARAECDDEAWEAREEAKQECRDQREARLDVCDLLGEGRYDPDPLKDPAIEFVDPDDINDGNANPYVILTEGHTYVLRAGEDFEETVVVTVTDEVREAEGFGDEPVLCRVVVDAVVIAEEDEDEGGIDYIPAEITDDYFAQDVNSNVYYCGEVSRNFNDEGFLEDLDGSFFSGVEYAKAGILLRAMPMVGDVDRQEYAIAEAEDVVEYVDLMGIPGQDEGGENPNNADFECAPEGCLKTRDISPLEPDASEFKYYKAGIGFVLATAFEDEEFTGEREELVCVGDSLDILQTDECGIEDVEGLLEDLCELAPDAFCDDD